ncbi:hypothetical protein H7691_02530 [Stenotrophomonas sp. CW117]|uniref:hypothetical protein n=1 Tax=Stenotrophomonas TaxID=40323 RepID=UPI000712EE2F|nr:MULTISPECIES: hypothetical protein [Stenotrophomonas]KRG87099.1 hypothetical protein ABB33_01400 [Stenotrophomonas acidaminiphila]QOF99052.1 hypothetical protein H7691_02530 [Stenotrophomonas sp. CW117]
MRSHLRTLAVILLALLLGAGSSYWFGASPTAVRPLELQAQAWRDGWSGDDDLLAASAIWQERAPWGAPPAPPVEASPPAPPPPMPVGVSKDGRNYTAIFQVNGTGVVRLRAGGRLPDGGHVLQVSGRRIVWLDAEGKRQQREIFNEFQGGQ